MAICNLNIILLYKQFVLVLGEIYKKIDQSPSYIYYIQILYYVNNFICFGQHDRGLVHRLPVDVHMRRQRYELMGLILGTISIVDTCT